MKNFMTRANLVLRAFLAERGRARNRLRREKTLGTRRSSPTWLTLSLFHSFCCHYLLIRAKTNLFHVHAFKDGQHVSEFKREFLSEHAHFKSYLVEFASMEMDTSSSQLSSTLTCTTFPLCLSLLFQGNSHFRELIEFFASCRNWLILER